MSLRQSPPAKFKPDKTLKLCRAAKSLAPARGREGTVPIFDCVLPVDAALLGEFFARPSAKWLTRTKSVEGGLAARRNVFE
jgi:hypothetical protein